MSEGARKRRPAFFGVHAAAGGVSSTIAAAITCPLEVVKTRQQSSIWAHLRKHEGPKTLSERLVGPFQTTARALGEVYRKEGLRALWKGLGPNLVGVIPARSIYFGVYGKVKHTLAERHGREWSWIHMVSAATAGATSATLTSPIWLIKTRMQLQSDAAGPDGVAHRKYRNSWHCLQMVLKEEGVRGLYKGLSASYLGIAESTIQFVTYEWLKAKLRERRIGYADPTPGIHEKTFEDWMESFLTAASAKLFAASVTYPHEVIRTRLREAPVDGGRSKYTGIVQCAKLIYKEEGFGALYGGMATHLIRVVPNASIMFLIYEVIVYTFS
ncbi:mitochondrial carrier domain-containing protein [Hyaloraphidium curvatum]|nr:mitochondrial carrier domain-containing protein [Hyaloraphidium curvatum]